MGFVGNRTNKRYKKFLDKTNEDLFNEHDRILNKYNEIVKELKPKIINEYNEFNKEFWMYFGELDFEIRGEKRFNPTYDNYLVALSKTLKNSELSQELENTSKLMCNMLEIQHELSLRERKTN